MNYQSIITPAALADNLYTSNWLILDCRGALESDDITYRKYVKKHIPNAYYCSVKGIFLNTLRTNTCNFLPSETIQVIERLEEWGFNETTQIIIYEDLNSTFTNTIWLKLRSLGLQNIAVLQGGFVSWREHNLPTSRDNDNIKDESLAVVNGRKI